MLTTGYLMNYEPRAQAQWEAKYHELSTLAAALDVSGTNDRAVAGRMNEDLQQAHQVFNDIAAAHDKADAGEISPSVYAELESRLASRLLVLMQSIVSDAVQLADSAEAQARAAQQITVAAVMTISGLGILAMIVIGVSADHSIIRPIMELQKTVSRVGRGDLDARSGITSGDEVGELAIAFDGMVTSLQDSYAMLQAEIAERRRAEEALHEYKDHLELTVKDRTSELITLNEDLQRATRAKDDFLASMSHELRTPLNSVIGFTDLILKGRTGDLNEEQRRQIHMVNEAGKQLLSLVNDVLDLSKINAGAAPVVATPFDPCDAVRRLADMMMPVAEAKGLELACHSDSGLPPEIFSDRGKIDQILLNLIGNAIKFTGTGGVTVTIRPGSAGMVAFDVTDTGIGIPAEEIDRVFEHFHRVYTDVPNEPGTGLGLAISRRLAEVLGGTLGVTSSVGEGSTFTLQVPARCADGEACPDDGEG
jgi:signal transduction histidine kinase